MVRYSSVSGLQSFPALATRLRGFRQGLRDRKEKKSKFEFRLNCKQRVTFHQGEISDNRFMSVPDAAYFFVYVCKILKKNVCCR